jgi:hypothetical protein
MKTSSLLLSSLPMTLLLAVGCDDEKFIADDTGAGGHDSEAVFDDVDGGASDEDTGAAADTGETVSWLMTQDAADVSFVFDETIDGDCAALDGLWSGEIVLHEIDDETLWFSDRPDRYSFTQPTEQFVAEFSEIFTPESGGLPNAVISWDDVADARTRSVVAQLDAPDLDGEDLSYLACGLPLNDPETLEPLPEDEQYIPPADPVIEGRVNLFIDSSTSGSSGDLERDTGPVFVAFSGGGWHSHTALAGWLSGTLQAGRDEGCEYSDLETLFTRVEAIAANSGGSWFMTQAAYSPDFIADLQATTDVWKTSGFLGQTEYLFFPDGSPPSTNMCARPAAAAPAAGFTDACNYSLFEQWCTVSGLTGYSSLNWQQLVEGVVYCPYKMADDLSSVTLSQIGERQSWAAGKDLIVASSLLTHEVVLEQNNAYNQLYDLRRNSSAYINGQNFTPLTFSSIASDRTGPQLLTQGTTTASYGYYSFVSGDYVWRKPQTFSATSTADVSVVEATVASSAAAGAMASQQALEQASAQSGYGYLSTSSGYISYYAADLAPPVRFNGDALEFPGAVTPGSYSALSSQRYARTADGGYVDNTAVAYLLRYMADNGLLDTEDGFDVVLFMNNTSNSNRQVGGASLPESVAVLFGVQATGSQPINCGAQVPFCSGGFCVCAPKNQVFTLGSGGVEEAWSYTGQGTSTERPHDVSLRYYKIDVRTWNEELFNLPGGLHGTLHLFTNEHFGSSAMPSTEDIMNSYKDVYDITREAVIEHDGYAKVSNALHMYCKE